MYSKLVDQLITKEIISAEDADLYLYGLSNGVLLIFNLITMFAIGLLFNRLAEIAVFLVSYAPLRHYCGGYHAKTAPRCYFISIVITLLVIAAPDHVNWSKELCLSVVLVSAVIIGILAPVADINKPLDPDETRVFKRMARSILIVEIFVFIMVFTFDFTTFYYSMSLAFMVMAIMLVLGIMKRKLN